MESKTSLYHGVPPELNGLNHIGRPVIGQQCYYNTSRKKSKVRLNDQLIPKPTDINMGEKMIRIATPKEHPYSSHISKFAMFPSFCSPDDPVSGVRAASQPFLSPHVPNRAPDVTLLSKTMGNPYRHEILEAPMTTRKEALMWTGEHGFLDQPKPLNAEKQVFYPTPPKKILPNPRLRGWDLSLSERTSNMLRNLERTLWLTSYQMHYTGSGPANPLKIDNIEEQMSLQSGINSHNAPLRERSFPVFVPSKPRGGGRRRRESLSNLSPAPNQTTTAADTAISRHGPREITAEHNEVLHPNQKGHNQSQEVLVKQHTESRASASEGRERENRKVQFVESPVRASLSQSSGEANADTQRPLDPHDRPLSLGEMEVVTERCPLELCAKEEPNCRKEYFEAGRNVSDLSEPTVAKNLSHIKFLTSNNPCILPRPPVLPGIGPVARDGAVDNLIDLQNSFSKTQAHHRFNSSVTRAAVNLRDNVVTGRKHDFYGINCNYLHG